MGAHLQRFDPAATGSWRTFCTHAQYDYADLNQDLPTVAIVE